MCPGWSFLKVIASRYWHRLEPSMCYPEQSMRQVPVCCVVPWKKLRLRGAKSQARTHPQAAGVTEPSSVPMLPFSLLLCFLFQEPLTKEIPAPVRQNTQKLSTKCFTAAWKQTSHVALSARMWMELGLELTPLGFHSAAWPGWGQGTPEGP